MWFLAIVSCFFVIGIIQWICSVIADNAVKLIYTKKLKNLEERERRLNKVLNDNSPFNFIASFRADAESYVFDNIERQLRVRAPRAADEVREANIRAKKYIKENSLLKYKLDSIISLFPGIDNYVPDEDDSFIEDNLTGEDPSKNWLNDEEFNKLPDSEKFQLALDRWKVSTKRTKRQVGYDYELYIGHLYRKQGWNVIQFGIEHGLDDLGRDIIATKVIDGIITTHIIQCKYWTSNSEIHENAICQLFGTAIKYHRDRTNNEERVFPVFVTKTTLSEKAKEFAEALHVIVREEKDIEDYPRIKCNINGTNKIYHLPFDQQYNTTKIGQVHGEFYALTVKEAENAGFRRAWRWHN